MAELTVADACKLLGVSRTTSHDVVKHKWKKLALKHHPDRETGDRDTFSKINQAYQIITGRDVEVIKITEIVFEEIWDEFFSTLTEEDQSQVREELKRLECAGD